MLPDREMTMQECAGYLRKVIRDHENGHGKEHTFYCMEDKKRYNIVLTPKNDYMYQVYTTALECIEGFTDEKLIKIALERGLKVFPDTGSSPPQKQKELNKMSEYEELSPAQSAEAMLRMLLSYHERVTRGNWRYNSFSNALSFGIDCIRKCYPSDFPERIAPHTETPMSRKECAEYLRDFLRHREKCAHNRAITFCAESGEEHDVTFTPENDLYHQVLTAALEYVRETS